jgi:GT2 family glycosyltransferase
LSQWHCQPRPLICRLGWWQVGNHDDRWVGGAKKVVEMSTVTAIVPTFNRVKYLPQCLESLLSQSRLPDKIIVVNDGSTDGTRSILRGLSGISVIEQNNSGKSAALNRALSECSSDYIWICDDDDIADPNGLQAMVEQLEAHPEAPFAYGLFKRFRDEDGVRRFEEPSFLGRKEEDSFLIQALEETFAFQFAQLVRLSAYRKAGSFREDLFRCQDFEMNIRLALLGEPVFIPKLIFYQRIHDGERGPQGQRFDGEHALQKWVEFGGRVVREVRQSLPESKFMPSFAKSWGGKDRRRAALLQRGLICAQRSLWPEALDDIEAAGELAEASATATREERMLCKSVIRSKLALLSLGGDAASIRRLRLLSGSSPYLHSIVSSMMRPILWNIRKSFRERQFHEVTQLAQCLTSILGPLGAVSYAVKSLIEKRS